jgi:hypothetical protein
MEKEIIPDFSCEPLLSFFNLSSPDRKDAYEMIHFWGSGTISFR